jgi:hypothetical protein
VDSTTAVRLLCISFTILSYINILLVTFSANPHTISV